MSFVDYGFARQLCEQQEVEMVKLARPSGCTTFEGKQTRPITHALYLPMSLGDHHVELNAFYVLSRSKYPVIIGKRWMENHGVLLDVEKGEVHFKKDCCKDDNVKQRNIEAAIEHDTSVKTLPEMDPEVNRSGKMMPTYHILKRVEKPEVLTEQLSSNEKLKLGRT